MARLAATSRAEPDANPFPEIARLPPGSILRGTIVKRLAFCYVVRFENGARGVLRTDDRLGRREVDVVVTSIDADEGRLELRLA